MAFVAKNLTSSNDGHTGRRARYETTDTHATVRAANYFNAAYNALSKGAILDVIAESDTATPKLCTYIVTASSVAGVTIALQTVA